MNDNDNETNSNIEKLINMILITSENAGTQQHQDSLYKLLQEEKNEISLTSSLLEILSKFNECINKLSQNQNLQLLIYIKNILIRFKAKPKLKQIPNFEHKVILGINFYLNFNFNNINNNNDYNKLKKIYDEIIPSLFDLIVVMKDSKKFLEEIYEKIIIDYLNNKNMNNILSHESVNKFIFVYENFCRIYLIYIFKNEEINLIFSKYCELLNFCKIFCLNITNNTSIKSEKEKIEIDEINAKLINQCILSFSKTSMLSLEHYIKSQILFINPNLIDNNQNSGNKKDKRFIFINNNSFLEFLNMSFYYDNNKNFSFGIEFVNNKEKRFDFLISKGKGILIEVLTVLIKKLTKFELFNSYENFNSETLKYYFNIVEYLINFYKAGNYPREKADNTPEEIIQLSVIVKIITFIDEIIDNQIYQKLIDTNLSKINPNNKNEKYEDIFKYIIVPNLLQTDLEKTFFEFDQDEYIKNLQDMCHTCEVKLPKQKSIKLLITLCDTIEGFLSKIVHIYILILKNITLSNNNNSNIEIEDKFKSLYTFLIQNLNSFNLIEQSLQVLTSISFLFGDKPDVSDYFCEEIDLINFMLVKITDPFLKSKLCIFYSYNLEILFHNNDEVLSKSFDDSLNFLFECIFNKTSNSSLRKTAICCINEVIFNKYIKKFCITSVCIYAFKVINYFNIEENLSGNEEEFNEFLKGIVKEYMYDLGDSTIQLFDLFWNKFLTILNKTEKNDKNNIENFNKNNNINNGVLKDRTKEVNEAMELSSQINIIKNFLNMVSNKNIDIKNNIYEKILSLFPKISSYLESDFEEEILQLISKVISDVKLLPETYFIHLKNYFNSLNKGIDNEYEYRIEKYHLDFIFTCLQSFKRNLIENEHTKEILINNLNFRLSSIRRCIPLSKIMAEHYIYCDMGLCIDIFFFDNFNDSNICDLIDIYYKRMEKIPNTDYDLNVKLCLNIFLLLIKNDNYEIFDKIFLDNKIVNLNNFLCKVISFFPFKDLSLIQHQIVAIFCSLIIRYMIIKQKNNQKILKNDEKDLNDKDTQKIFYFIFNLNLTQLNLIKNKSMLIINNNEKKEEQLNQKNQKKEIILDSYIINENNGKNNFKKNTQIIFNERIPHNKSLIKKYDYSDKDNDSIDYNANEDDFLINNENEFIKNENKNKIIVENDDYDDENINPIDDDENNIYNDNSDSIDDLDENIDDDRDEEFLTIKNKSKDSFMYYYNKFANEELIVYLKQINEFHLFEIMMKDIEINDINFLNTLLNQIKTSQGENKLKLIQEFKGIQKIEFKNRNIFSYRKIVKIQNNKNK